MENTKQENGIIKIKDDSIFREIEAISKEYAQTSIEQNFIKPAIVANAIKELKIRLDDKLVEMLNKNLSGTKLGFKTDKDSSGGYPVSTVKNCFIEAVLNGFYWTGNEFNIIAGNFYPTREGLTNKMNRDGRYSNLKIKYGVPKNDTDKRAVISFVATWMYDGKNYDLDDDIPIKVNNYMTDDAIIGKANRKIRARIIELCEGISFSETDADEVVNERLNKQHEIKQSDFNFVNYLTSLQKAELEKIISNKKIKADNVFNVLKNYGFNTLDDITNDLFLIIKGELESFRETL